MAAQDAGRRGHHLPLPNLPQASPRGGGTGVTFREVRLNQGFSNSIQNKVAGERKWLNFDQNFDQNKVFKKEMCRSKERSNQEEM